MDGLSLSLLLAAAGVAVVHTALGPDHYLPFVMLARARGWSPRRTAVVTALCGLGHVASSVVLGGVGVLLGIGVARLERVDATRGSLAAWALVALGLAYAVWGLRKALRRSRGIEPHTHDGEIHLHAGGDRPHDHDHPRAESGVGFWTLFAIFVLGPCEPLIPLFILPASRGRWDLAALSALVFGATTIAVMVSLTLLQQAGLDRIRLGALERWSHTLAGMVIAISGLTILFLGL
jgi:hypothetical protein